MPGVGQLACILLYISVIYHKQGVMAFPMSKTISSTLSYIQGEVLSGQLEGHW